MGCTQWGRWSLFDVAFRLTGDPFLLIMKTIFPYMKAMRDVVFGLCALVGLLGCDRKEGGLAAGKKSDQASKKIRIAFVGGAPGDYWSILRLGCDQAVRGAWGC